MRVKRIIPILIAMGFFLQTCDQASQYREYIDVNEMVTDAKTRISEITLEKFNELLEGEEMFTIIDVRTQEEHDAGYIPGSLSIPRGLIEFRISSEEYWEEEGMYVPLKDETLVIYCRSGNRSALAAETLEKLGYTQVFSLEGGFNGWKEAFPDKIEKNLAPAPLVPAGVITEEKSSGGC